jgi:hypothetical protein
LIKRAAAAEISPEMTDSRTTVVTTGISRVTKSRKPTSTAEERNNGRERCQTRNEAEGYLKLAADAEKDRAPSGSCEVAIASNEAGILSARQPFFLVVGFTRADTRPFWGRFRPNFTTYGKEILTTGRAVWSEGAI